MLIQCQNVSALSVDLVEAWLTAYMFKGEADGPNRAKSIATWLANHAEFKMHGRHINREQLRARGLKILNLEDDKDQQDFILSIYHATTHSFTHSGAVKIIENHRGNAYIEQVQQVMVQSGPMMSAPPSAHPPGKIEPPFKKKHR